MAEHRAFFNTHKPKSTDGIFQHVLNLLPEEREGIAVDICCGSGALASQVAEQGYTSLGVDISDAYIGQNSTHAHGFAVADTNQMPLASQQASLLTFIDSLQYFEDPNAMLAETSRLLQSGGYLIISCQNNFNLAGIKKWLIQALTGRTWSPWLVHPVENFLLYPDVIRMLEANGYTVEYVRGKQLLTAWVSLLPSFIRNWTPWKDKPWRSLASIASRINLPKPIEESFLARFAMIVLIRARKN